MTDTLKNPQDQNQPKEETKEQTLDIPEKFKDPKTGELNAELLLKSYKELEQKLSQGQKKASQEAQQMPRRPEKPEDYPVCCDHGLFEPDMDINRKLYDNDFSPDQAQIVYDLGAERMLPMLKDVVAQFRAEREVEKLVNEFGGKEQWRGLSRQLLSFGKQNLPADVLDNLCSSYEGVMALYRMMQAGGEPKLSRGRGAPMQGALNEKELSSMMRDPKYWREKDPAYIAKVTQGFEGLYR